MKILSDISGENVVNSMFPWQLILIAQLLTVLVEQTLWTDFIVTVGNVYIFISIQKYSKKQEHSSEIHIYGNNKDSNPGYNYNSDLDLRTIHPSFLFRRKS